MRRSLVSLVAVVAVVVGIACASMPVKQRAYNGLKITATTVNQLQDFERANYAALGETAVASDKMRRYCPATALTDEAHPNGQPLPAGANIHQVIACLFAQATASLAASSSAVMAFDATHTPPTALGELRGEIDTLFDIIKGLSSNVNQQKALALAQSTVDSVLNVVAMFGGAVPSLVPGGVA